MYNKDLSQHRMDAISVSPAPGRHVARSKVRRPSGRSDPQPACRDHRQRERVLDIKIKSSPRYQLPMVYVPVSTNCNFGVCSNRLPFIDCVAYSV